MEDIEKFISGFSRFQQQYFQDSQALFDSLREAAPQHAADRLLRFARRSHAADWQRSGRPVRVRNIANLVPACTPTASAGVSSAIEFAVCELEVERIIILGHALRRHSP
jgi:carbonic anhydrase